MPEGDTVFRTAARLRAALEGQQLTGCDIRVPRYATVDLTGSTVDTVLARGKHLLIRLGENSIHTHLKMEGAWEVYRSPARWRHPAHTARIVLRVPGTEAVGFALGVTELIPVADEEAAIGPLGPDLLGPDWDADLAAANLRRDPDRPIGLALLDQRLLAGIGNVYRCELCFLRGVHPATPVARAGDPAAWVDLAHRLLVANRDRAVRITTGDRRRGRSTWVYERARRPCLRCGTIIRTDTLGGAHPGRPPGDEERMMRWCPGCQR